MPKKPFRSRPSKRRDERGAGASGSGGGRGVPSASVLRAVRQADGPMTARRVAGALNINQRQVGAVAKALEDLVREGDLMMTRPGSFVPAGSEGQYQVEVIAAGDGVIARLPDGTEHPIPEAHRLGAGPGDQVQVMITDDGEALVVAIIQRLHREMLGSLDFRGQEVLFVPDIRRLGSLPVIKSPPDLLDQHQANDRLVARQIKDINDRPAAEILRRIDTDSPELADFARVVLNHDLPGPFPPEVEEAAKAAGERIKDVRGRRDCREDVIFTIDPETAKDFDDAISVTRTKSGGWQVAVHIADVSHYVPQNETIDNEARVRGTSCYLVNRVIPMLPEVLSNGVCSLVPHEDRNCLSAFIDLDKSGKVTHVDLAETRIHSRHRFTYEQALALIESRGEQVDAPDEVVRDLLEAHNLAQRLRANREANGALNLYSVEYNVECDAEGEPLAIHAETGDVSHQLIEELMLLANRCVASWLDERGWNLVYRVHGEPDEKKLVDFNRLLAAYGLHDYHVEDRWSCLRVIKRLEQEPEAVRLVMNGMLLRCFQKAVYQTQNIGHYALAFRHYCHFTSPIRRYPDLIVHRLVKAALHIDGYEKTESRQPHLEAWARQCSFLEQRAAIAERDLKSIKAARYLARHLGDVFAGVVMAVTPAGCFIQLLEVGLDGMLPIRDLGNEFFTYYEERLALVGSDTGLTFAIGTLVDVMVVAVDADRGQVTLSLADQPKQVATDGGPPAKRQGGRSQKTLGKRDGKQGGGKKGGGQGGRKPQRRG